MATEVLMPQMGESIAEGTITTWLVAVGDEVKRDQPLFEISTDKVDAEIPSPADGVLLERRFAEGTTVAVNDVVALIGDAGEVDSTTAAPGPAAAIATAGSAPDESSQVAMGVNDGDSAVQEELDRLRRFSSPVVRKIASKEDVDISTLTGTGIHGRVTKKDILGHLEARDKGVSSSLPGAKPVAAPASVPPDSTRATGTPAPPSASQTPAVERQQGGFSVPAYTEGEPVVIEPMSKIRQITAAHMVYSRATSAHVSTVFHMNFSRVVRARNRAKAGFLAANATKLTYMPFIFKAVAGALKANPKLNAAIDGTNIVFKKEINLGMAVALDRGLLVPVIRNADQLNLVGLAKAANGLADKARSKKLLPEDLQRGTFTITNPGVFGNLFGMPIINQPQVAILGIGAIEKRPIVETDAEGNDILAIKPMSYFCISYDHRLVDGSDADEFMNHVKRVLIEDSWSELDTFM